MATNSVRVCFGMSVYNESSHLKKAISSILKQRYDDFLLIIFDNGSTDNSAEIIDGFARKDPRIRFFRGQGNRGMIRGMRLVYKIAKRECPSFEFFAWAAGHDEWHPDWLTKMIFELDGDPKLALVYPQTQYIDTKGIDIKKGKNSFETVGLDDQIKRFCYSCLKAKRVGNMAYGLFRQEMFRKAGIYRPVLLPDKLLMLELSLYGKFKLVDEFLWYRREFLERKKTSKKVGVISRQKSTLFGPRKKPKYFKNPWWMTMGWVFYGKYVKRKKDILSVSYYKRLYLCFYLVTSQVVNDIIKRYIKSPFFKVPRKFLLRLLKRNYFKKILNYSRKLKSRLLKDESTQNVEKINKR